MIATPVLRAFVAVGILFGGLVPSSSVEAATRPSAKILATNLSDLPCRNSFAAEKNGVVVIAYLNEGTIITRRTTNGGMSWESNKRIDPAAGEDIYNTNVECSVQVVSTKNFFFVGAYMVTEYDSPGYYQFWRSTDGKSWIRSGRVVDVEPQLTQVMIAGTASRIYLAGVQTIIENPECLADPAIWCDKSLPLKVVEIPVATMVPMAPVELYSSVVADETNWAGFAIQKSSGDGVIATWTDSMNYLSSSRVSAGVWRSPFEFMTLTAGSPVTKYYEARAAFSGVRGLMAYAGTYDSALRWRWSTNGGTSWGSEKIRRDSSKEFAMVRAVWAAGTSYRVAVERWDEGAATWSSEIYQISSAGAARLWTARAGESVIGGISSKGRSIVFTRKSGYDPANCVFWEDGDIDCSPYFYSVFSYRSP